MMNPEPNLTISPQNIDIQWMEGPEYREGFYGEETVWTGRHISFRNLLQKVLEGYRKENVTRTNEYYIQDIIDALKIEIEYLENEKEAEMNNSQTIQGQSGPIKIINVTAKDGVVLGGACHGTGMTLSWQDGALEGKPANGTFVEDVLLVAMERLKSYQENAYACEENEVAIKNIKKAIKALNKRTEERKKRGVEGTMSV